MKLHSVKRLVLAAVLLALGIVLPLLTGQIKEIGDSLLPMHLPVLLCGFLCGWKYGLTVGLLLPPMRSLFFGMPPIYPNAVWMALELGTYGAVAGILYERLPKKSILWLYGELICAMLAGRAVWGISKSILLGVGGKPFTAAAFFAGGFVDALPGILLQLILIPPLVTLARRMRKNNV